MRILITGSRDYRDLAMIEAALSAHTRSKRGVTIVHGGARGADTLASAAARSCGLDEEVHLAKWRTHGKAAGPIRNQHMVDLGADICLAFPTPSSRGTWDCVERARAANSPDSKQGAMTMTMRNGLPDDERNELAFRVVQGGLFRKYRLDHLRKQRLVDVIDPGLTYADLEDAVAVATCFRGKEKP